MPQDSVNIAEPQSHVSTVISAFDSRVLRIKYFARIRMYTFIYRFAFVQQFRIHHHI